MTITESREKALSYVASDFARTIANVQKNAGQLEVFLQSIPSDIPDDLRKLLEISVWDVRYGKTFHVSVAHLPIIRKIVGRMSMEGKTLAGDFDDSNEIVVTLKPVSLELNTLSFSYRTQFRGGGKCHVEHVTNNSSYKTLVCKS